MEVTVAHALMDIVYMLMTETALVQYTVLNVVVTE